MKIRLGYVSIALNLKKVTASSTLTYTRYSKLSEAERLEKLKKVAYSNLEALEQILKYNIENDIHFYRLTSNLIPLATHPEVMWDYMKFFKKDFEYIGKIIKENDIRIDTHPDQFNVINSLREDVVKNTIVNLKIQSDWFEAMNYNEAKMVIHIGSSQGGKEDAINRFIDNVNLFPKEIKNKLILENDDKTFTSTEVLYICRKTKLPMVLDVHHYNCNNCEEKLEEVLPEVFDTWEGQDIVPKIHFSSPREFDRDRKHADYIDVKEFIQFINLAKKVVDKDFDVMIEAKMKDKAIFKLMEDLKKEDLPIKYIDKTSFEI